MSFIELFFRGGQVTGLGVLAIFAIIATIFVVIKTLGATAGSEKKSAPKATKPVAESKPEPEPAAAEETAAEEAAGDDLELIAILAAAVSAYSGEPVTKFRVVSFKHIK